ncbi:iron chelate uptake ABC transporter family permease subunit [Sinorhizobium medicae]|nr:iron chelate uptake ABC transporter family permease subunit [Sinorhizobium medicae]MDX0876249.1 iron chelate uptake ABC transporter family permease subunit [Sinorhizobium medicae]MDX0955191.1 iron chelate uptake ABC transporter family permease subunit [Sinorhizobium medicae]MDX1065416.1 iron chelate uptake ABC transporter family permease subunit [Sinorhizobium medicae]
MTRTTRLAACAASLVMFLLSLSIGAGEFSLSRLIEDPESLHLLVASRLPRTLAALFTGAALSIAGLILQAMVRNRFVEPSTAGTSQSAALGILLMTLFFPAAPIAVKMLAASILALVGTSLFLMSAHRLPPTQPYLVPLFGIVYGGVIGATVTYIGWQTELLQFIEIWTNGEFSGVMRGRYELLWGTVGAVAIAWWTADRLTVLSLGRDVSIGLGLNYQRTLQLALVIVSVVSALTVVVVGIIPFVGLVVPNIVSRLMGDNLRGTIPWVALCGGLLVLGCDILGRLLRYPYEIPVSTVMGVVGALLFLRLMFGRPTYA